MVPGRQTDRKWWGGCGRLRSAREIGWKSELYRDVRCLVRAVMMFEHESSIWWLPRGLYSSIRTSVQGERLFCIVCIFSSFFFIILCLEEAEKIAEKLRKHSLSRLLFSSFFRLCLFLPFTSTSGSWTCERWGAFEADLPHGQQYLD